MDVVDCSITYHRFFLLPRDSLPQRFNLSRYGPQRRTHAYCGGAMMTFLEVLIVFGLAVWVTALVIS